MVDRLYEHTAYADAPFGPYEAQRHVFRSGGVALDVLNAQTWALIFNLDTSPFKVGQLAIDADIFMQDSFNAWRTDPEALPWIELRVTAKTGNSEVIWFEGGLTSMPNLGSRNASVLLPFKQGEVPDSISVYAQARQGAGIVTPGLFTMTVTPATRFVL